MSPRPTPSASTAPEPSTTRTSTTSRQVNPNAEPLHPPLAHHHGGGAGHAGVRRGRAAGPANGKYDAGNGFQPDPHAGRNGHVRGSKAVVAPQGSQPLQPAGDPGIGPSRGGPPRAGAGPCGRTLPVRPG